MVRCEHASRHALEARARMNPFQRMCLIRSSQHFNSEEAYVHGYGAKGVFDPSQSSRPVSSVWRSDGRRAGVRNRIVRLALRQLRRTNRSCHPRPSQAGACARRSRIPLPLAQIQHQLNSCSRPGGVSPPSMVTHQMQSFLLGTLFERVPVHAPCSVLFVR